MLCKKLDYEIRILKIHLSGVLVVHVCMCMFHSLTLLMTFRPYCATLAATAYLLIFLFNVFFITIVGK